MPFFKCLGSVWVIFEGMAEVIEEVVWEKWMGVGRILFSREHMEVKMRLRETRSIFGEMNDM